MAEILAPAGGMEQVYAAVRCGANAVYLGAQGFNARRNAVNFDEETLPQAVSYCHVRGAKVYVTVNTLILDGETEKLAAEADLVAGSGADAVIVQDFSVLRYFKDRYPSLKCFASTQTAVHNISGALKLQDLGFDGIVLARELTLNEMEKICRAVSVNTEAFIHGAHCMSVSGACYLSCMLGGRSGNRGMCAQPCRLDWNNGKNGYALSLKDMSLIRHIREMSDIGVNTFKIEGRMKRPEYVAATVTACRQALGGQPYDEDTLRAVFSRSGFTDGYLTGKRDASMFGVRTKDDVESAKDAIKGLARLYDKETPLVPVDVRFRMDDAGSMLSLSDGINSVEISGPVPVKAVKTPTDPETVRKSLEKFGGTPYYPDKTEYAVKEGLNIPISSLNAMRREAAETLTRIRGEISAPVTGTYDGSEVADTVINGDPGIWVRVSTPAQLGDNIGKAARVIVPVAHITEDLVSRFGERLTAEMPPVLFPDNEPQYRNLLKKVRSMGVTSLWADNIYAVAMGKDEGMDVLGGFRLNISNSRALREYTDLGLKAATLSFEISMNNVKHIRGTIPRGIAAYGRLPLMHFRNCPVKAGKDCSKCKGNGFLTDRYGIRFPVECQDRLSSTLLNSVPLHIADRDLSGLSYVLLWFTKESADEADSVIDDFVLGRSFGGERTGGMYYRELI